MRSRNNVATAAGRTIPPDITLRYTRWPRRIYSAWQRGNCDVNIKNGGVKYFLSRLESAHAFSYTCRETPRVIATAREKGKTCCGLAWGEVPRIITRTSHDYSVGSRLRVILDNFFFQLSAYLFSNIDACIDCYTWLCSWCTVVRTHCLRDVVCFRKITTRNSIWNVELSLKRYTKIIL